MARPAAWNDEQRVDADVVAGAGVALSELLGGGRDPTQAVTVEREVGGFAGGALLNLDEGDDPAAAGDEIDLAAVDPRAAGEDPPAVEAKPPGGERFGAAAATLGECAVQAPSPSSRARA